MTVFAGLPRAYGVYVLPEGGATAGKKRKGKAETLQAPVTEALWDRHLAGEIQLGIVPIRDDNTCVFGAIDIDDYDVDHAALGIKITKLKLPLTMFRTKSGGAHLMIFLRTPMAAAELRERLADWAAALGHADVEIFPKQNKLLSHEDTGNWINMPYCGGDKSDRYAIASGEKLGVETFLAHAELVRVEPNSLKSTEPEAPGLLEDGPPCLITLSAQGAPEGTRNIVMFNYAVYARKRWADDWTERLAEINTRFISPPLEESELLQIASHAARKDYSYTCRDKPLCNVCIRPTCVKRKFGIGPSDAQEYFGLGLKNVIRLETDPPVYFADMNGKRIRFEAADLVSQTDFRKLTVMQVNEAFGIVPAPKWIQFVSKVCADAEVVKAPPEAQGEFASLLSQLEEYCVEQVQAREWDDVIDGQVFSEDKRVFFRPEKWIKALNKETRGKRTVKEAFVILRDFGLTRVEKTIRKRKYTLWSFPEFERPEKRHIGDSDL